MKILFLGDIVGRSGRDMVIREMPVIRARFQPDFVIVNGENASGGFGLTAKHARALLDAGVDCLTLGDHSFDQKDMYGFLEENKHILRPLNIAKQAPGKGTRIFRTPFGNVVVMQALGQLFMKAAFDDPYSAVDEALKPYVLGGNTAAIFVDYHAEATSEKMAMGHYLDGRVSAVVGTHTHVPTADTMILPKGTAFQSDAGMCGCYHSVIGFDKEEPIRRMVTRMSKGRLEPKHGDATLSGVWFETEASGRAVNVKAFRYGGYLAESLPTEV